MMETKIRNNRSDTDMFTIKQLVAVHHAFVSKTIIPIKTFPVSETTRIQQKAKISAVWSLRLVQFDSGVPFVASLLKTALVSQLLLSDIPDVSSNYLFLQNSGGVCQVISKRDIRKGLEVCKMEDIGELRNEYGNTEDNVNVLPTNLSIL